MTQQPAQEGEHGERLERRFAAFGIVAVGETDRAPVVMGDAVLGEDGPLGVAADVAQAGGGIEQASADVRVLGDVEELLQRTVEEAVLAQERRSLGELQLAVAVGLTQRADHVIAPHLLQARVRHQPAQVVGRDPALAVQRQATLGNEQVQMRVPLQIGAEGVDHGDQPHAHAVLIGRPLGEAGVRRARQQRQAHFRLNEITARSGQGGESTK